MAGFNDTVGAPRIRVGPRDRARSLFPDVEGRDIPMSRPSTLPPEWLALANALGGVGKLAEACHVTPVSVHRWGTGRRPKSRWQREEVARLARKHGLRDPLEIHARRKRN